MRDLQPGAERDHTMSSSRTTSSSRDREEAVTSESARESADHSLTVAARTAHSLTVAAPNSEGAPGPVLLDDDWRGAGRTVSKAEIESQPYFITFTCYGTWLHGDERSFPSTASTTTGKRRHWNRTRNASAAISRC